MINEEAIIERNLLNRIKKKAGARRGAVADSTKPDMRTKAEKEIDEAIAKSAVKEKRDKSRKKRIKWGIGGLGLAFLAYGFRLLLVPFEGDLSFGVCKLFLELNSRFPHTIRLSEVEVLASSVRIWYVDTDAFGQQRLEPIQCYYKEDQTYGMIIDRITIDRRDVDPLKVNAFNRILPVILQNPPDLSLPDPLPDNLEDLNPQTQKFLKPILDRMPGR